MTARRLSARRRSWVSNKIDQLSGQSGSSDSPACLNRGDTGFRRPVHAPTSRRCRAGTVSCLAGRMAKFKLETQAALASAFASSRCNLLSLGPAADAAAIPSPVFHQRSRNGARSLIWLNVPDSFGRLDPELTPFGHVVAADWACSWTKARACSSSAQGISEQTLVYAGARGLSLLLIGKVASPSSFSDRTRGSALVTPSFPPP